MDNGKADIIAGIRELRAKAAEQLTGNEYYMIVQQLDSLATSAELSDAAARSVFSLISQRLGGGAPAISASGGPEVPETPATPAQPDTPSTPEAPVMPGSPAQPDGSPGPEIPSPPSSPAEPQTPPEASGAPVLAADSEDRVRVIAPSANSFGMPQATVGVRSPEPAAPSEPAAAIPEQEAAPVAEPAGGLASAIMAARALIEERLSGNSYYAAANLLGQLQILPPIAGGGEPAARPDGFEGALALLRREAAHLTGIAHDEAARVIAALENVLMPQPRPVAETPAESAAPQPAAAIPEAVMPEAATLEAAMPEAEIEPRTGFDGLAEAAWQRVRHVSAAASPTMALNGSPAPAAAARTEMMAQDIGEAFNDGGSESRSSEPCTLHEFEPAGARHGASDRQEPAAEAGADAASETQRQAAVPAEAPGLIALAEAGAEAPVAVEDAIVLTVLDEAVTEPRAAEPEETVPLEEPVVAAAELAAATAPVIEELAEPACVAAPASSEAADEGPPARTGPAAQAMPAKPAKRGFFGRLFGGAAAENRR